MASRTTTSAARNNALKTGSNNFGRDGNQEERQIIKHIQWLFIQQHGKAVLATGKVMAFIKK